MAENPLTKARTWLRMLISYSFVPVVFPVVFGVFSLFVASAGVRSVNFSNAQSTTNAAPTLTRTATISFTPSPTATRTFTPTPVPTVTNQPLAPERSQQRYSVDVTNMYVLFASHILENQPKAANEYRVLLIGDSGTWSHYMPFAETLAGRLNAANLPACNSHTIKVYNMAIRGTSLAKDLVFIDKAATYKPDLVIWFLTLNTFRPDTQLSGQNFMPVNRAYLTDLSKRYNLGLNTSSLKANTQTTDQAWAIIQAAQEPPHLDAYPTLDNNQVSSNKFTRSLVPPKLSQAALPFNLFYAGLKILSKTKTLVVNEPIFVATGTNSNLRYNEYYPRWAYDQFRPMLLNESKAHNWNYLDLWNAIPSAQFTGTPLHRTPYGEFLMYRKMAPIIQQSAACQ